MSESSVIDLRDRANPPPDDAVNAPYGYRWNTKDKQWDVKRSAGGRKSGAAWFGEKAKEFFTEPDPEMKQFEQQFDPEPAHMKPAAARRRKAPPRVTAKVKDDLTASVGLVGMLVLPPLVAKDPYCGGALADNFQSIADAVVPLLCKSSTVVGFFTDTGSDFMLWFKLGMALTPVAMAVGRHHLLKSVEIQQDEQGELYVVSRDMSEYSTEEE